jgi:hypothetical protein
MAASWLSLARQDMVLDKFLAYRVTTEAQMRRARCVHEVAHARAGRPDHLSERLLADLGDYGLRPASLAEVGQQESSRANLFSVELKSWSTKSSSTRALLAN